MSSSDATMSSPLFVPSALQFYVNRLSFSKNRVRLQALSTQVASANSQIIVRLPSNTMINLASITMTGGVRATILNTVPEEGVALPTNWDFSFIETLSLIANLVFCCRDSIRNTHYIYLYEIILHVFLSHVIKILLPCFFTSSKIDHLLCRGGVWVHFHHYT